MNKKITLKVGALGLLAVAGISGLIAQMPSDGEISFAGAVAPWYKTAGGEMADWPTIVSVEDGDYSLKGAAYNGNLLDLYDLIGMTGTNEEWQPKQYSVPFAKLSKDGLMPGVFVSFDNVVTGENGNKVYDGQFFDGYETSFETTNTPFVAKINVDGSAALGVMPTKTNNGRVEFLISTRGLTHVDNLKFWLGAYAAMNEQPNRNLTWEAVAEIYDVQQEPAAREIDIDIQGKDYTLGEVLATVPLRDLAGGTTYLVGPDQLASGAKAYNLTLSKQNINGEGSINLDNKIIRIVCSTTAPSVAVTSETTDHLEPLTLFSNFTVDFARPHITFSNKDTEAAYGTTANDATYTSEVSICEAYEAGAGRETENDTIYVKVNNWNPKNDVKWAVDSLNLANSPMKLDVAYPFQLVGIQGADGNLIKESDLVKKEKRGVAGMDSVVTYFVDRATFTKRIREYTSTSSDNEYKTFVVYKFAPQHVQKYDPTDYIKATIVAASADTAKLNINGSSLPQFAFEKDTLMFSDYTEFQKVAVSIKNLPNFSLNGTYEWVNAMGIGQDDTWKTTINQRNNALWLQNYTEDPEAGNTNRYSDDVFFSGWFAEDVETDNLLKPLADLSKYLTIEGNLKSDITLYAGFWYNREDISQSDPESFIVNEKFGVAKNLKYTSAVKVQTKQANYTGVQFDKTEDSFGNKEWAATECNTYQIICERMTIHGDNSWVYFSLPTISHSIADAMTSICGNKDDYKVNDFINKFVKPDYKGRVDLFFAPYVNSRENPNNYGVKRDSRTHTIWIKGFNLRPDSANTTKATIKVFKEGGSKIVWDDRYFWGEQGQSIDPNRYDNTFYYSTDAQYGSFRDAQGNSLEQGYYAGGDTLYYVVDLNDEKQVSSLKTKGLPLHVLYSPEVNQYNKGMINNAVQFGISTLDGKAMNEFWCVGTTDRGVVTNMYGDAAVGSYESFTNAIGKGFSIHEYDVDGIYADMFKKKSYEPYYIGQDCYTQDSSEFVVSGLNLIAPVKIEELQKDANEHGMILKFLEVPTQGAVAINDPEVTNYGYEEDGLLYPNRYGELLMRVVVRPFAENTTGLIDTTYVEKFHNNPEVTIARKLAIKNLKLEPVQTTGRETTRVYTFDTRKTSGTSSVAGEDVEFVGRLNEANHFNSVFDSWFDEMGVVEATSVNVDVMAAIMKPQLYFAYKDAEGNLNKFDLSNPLEFGSTVVGEGKDSLIYIVGEDLAHYGTGYNPVTGEGANSIPDEITLTAEGNYSINGATTYTVKVEDLKESSKNNGWQDGYMEIPVHFVADPDADDPCAINGGITASAMCAVEGSTLISLGATYDVDFMKDRFADFKVTGIGAEADRSGNMARFEWEGVPGATSYNMVLGHYKEDKTSADIFISEFAFDPASSKLTLELFNGTGAGIAPGINHHYYVEVIADDEVVLEKTNIVAGENIDKSDITMWYQAVAFDFTPEKTAFSKMTVKLYNGDSLIDIVEFDSNTKGLSRNPALDYIGITTQFNLGDGSWTTLYSSLPVAEFGWEETFETIIETGKTYTDTKIEANNLKPNLNNHYVARLYAHSDCTPEEGILVGEVPFATSVSDAPDGPEAFANFNPNPPTGNENIDMNAVRVLGGQGSVTILNATGKTVTISNVLGQKFERVLTSDRETVTAPKGIVIVAVQGETAVKAIVK